MLEGARQSNQVNNCGEKIFHTEVDAVDDNAKDGGPWEV